MYKLSRYNYILTNFPEAAILFNGLTKKFFLIKREKLAQYVNLLNSFQDLVDIPTPHLALLQKMISAGFIVKENVDEFQLVRKREHDFFETKEYQTIIIPTYDCNYSCWYCTQKHQPTELQDMNVERIKKHIISYIEQNNILTYHLCWFGGEPLMQKNRVVEISNDLYQYCLVNNIEFCGQITTNGALLDEKLIRQLSSVKIDRYQITIDGNRENHNQTKKVKNSTSSFDLILNNVKMLLELNSRSIVVLRLNYNSQKLKDFDMVRQLDEIIPNQLRNRIYVDFQRIWQAKFEQNCLHDLYVLMDLFAKSGYTLSTNAFFSACYVEKTHFETIYYDGKVDFCDNYDSNMARGSIEDDGSVSWNAPLPTRIEKNKAYSVCGNCSFYPVCTGECMAKRDKRLRLGMEFVCSDKRKQEIEFNMLDYCFRCMLNSKYKKI